jgi:hypothetical protein
MQTVKDEKFIKRVETLIDPAEVNNLYFFAGFKKLLPRAFFKKLLIKTSKKTPYMGFVIEPYCLFLFFKLKNIEKAKSLLPQRYELVKAKIFDDEEPDYYHGMGIFNAKASTFWGTRLESYLIARDTQTGLLSWIFVDIISNTLIARPFEGVAERNSSHAIYTTNSKGGILLDIREDKSGRELILNGSITGGVKRRLDQPLWLLGNTSIAHSAELSDGNHDPFAVVFDPAEVESALDIPPGDIEIKSNTLFTDLAEKELVKVLCFPYAQHYIADSPGCRTEVKDAENMLEHYTRIADLQDIKTFSTKSIKFSFFSGIIAAYLLSAVMFVLYILK